MKPVFTASCGACARVFKARDARVIANARSLRAKGWTRREGAWTCAECQPPDLPPEQHAVLRYLKRARGARPEEIRHLIEGAPAVFPNTTAGRRGSTIMDKLRRAGLALSLRNARGDLLYFITDAGTERLNLLEET